MSRRDYKKWYYYLEEGDHTLDRVLVEKKGGTKIGDRFRDINGTDWVVWYVEEGRGVHNARLERATPSSASSAAKS